ncbi:XdhC family protein [Hymenobacter sp. BT491]|uniref:XdhC family protein n=1 Tax=Hymenobacter sp. BT491 TaxID=2766779 RepID=UPI0016539BEC|nr:XdhC/CoxI family protein [Hymenobacter sp. BT491]MBC6991134.1 XdhC family protein [Hymenobacter sp. BT491]
MHRALATWQFLSESVGAGLPTMLLYVLESHGSSPGRQGFVMGVNANGAMQGSIGGGIMEHKFVQLAREQLASGVAESAVRKQIHNKTAPKDQSGMICSGEQTILLYPLQSPDYELITDIISCLQHEQQGVLTLSPAGLAFAPDQGLAEGFAFRQQSETDWLYQEQLGYKQHLHIVGGGHCSLALSRLMRTLDFRISLYEDRPQLNTFLENDAAHRKTVVETYHEMAAHIPDGANQYVVIMTVGYRTDDIAVRALLPKNLRFLGVLGSQKKIEKLLGDYRAEGISPAYLAKLCAPVGLPIHSQTPEEIAISIAAQLISVKNHKS